MKEVKQLGLVPTAQVREPSDEFCCVKKNRAEWKLLTLSGIQPVMSLTNI